MNYMVSGYQPSSILRKADEILIYQSSDNVLFDYEQDYKDKKIIIYVTDSDRFSLYKMFREKGLNIVLEIDNFDVAKWATLNSIPWFWKYEVSTFIELDTLLHLGASEIILGDNLFFNLDRVKRNCERFHAKLRKLANVAYYDGIPRENGVEGAYIRPEDVKIYEDYIDTIYFDSKDLETERTLLKIYKENKCWQGNLNFLIQGLGYNIDNRGISDEFAVRRLNCRHICSETGSCHLCYSEFMLVTKVDKADKETIDFYKEQIND